MKITGLVIFFLFVGASTVFAQDTVAPQAKKLEQLYLSAGTGTAFTFYKEAKPFGLNLNASITWANESHLINRFDFYINGFKDRREEKTEKFTDFLSNNFEYFSPGFSVGRKHAFSQTLQLQGFAGGSLNFISLNTYISPEDFALGEEGSCFPVISLRPGILLQAEVLSMPSRFHGFSFGLFYNVSPWFYNGGVNLKINLGKVR